MTALLLADGGPLTVESLDVRIGAGPWARWLATAAVPDESTHRAERGRRLARTGAVGAVRVAEGRITARVTGSTGNEYDVSLGADPVRSTAWDAAVRATRGRSALQAAAAGEAQSVQLAHLLETRFGARLAPTAKELRRSCTCPDDEPSGALRRDRPLEVLVHRRRGASHAPRPGSRARRHRSGECSARGVRADVARAFACRNRIRASA